MKKILFGITSLTLGGAERVLVDIANKLCDKYDITIFTLYENGELEKELNNKIKRKSLYKVSYLELSKINQKILVPLKVLLLKKWIYNKYVKGNFDVEIAFLEGPITRLFSIKNENTRKIAWVHNDMSKVFGKNLKAKIKKNLDKRTYEKYQDIIFVSKDNLDRFNELYGENLANRKVIYNYIDKDTVIKKAEENIEIELNQEEMNFVTVARLVPQKSIDRLIKVESKLAKENLNCNFYVIGEGPEKAKLQELIQREKIENNFKLLGKKENPYPYIKKATYFCLLSEFEGYGMVLEEAKILNKPIIITDTAAREAIKDYKNSIVLENTFEGIYEGLAKIIKENNTNIEQEKQDYDNSNIIREIIKLIGE